MKRITENKAEKPLDKHELVKELTNCGRLMKGSLTRIRRRCGKSQCRCMRGQLHESLAITYKKGRKSFLIHVPGHLHTQAREAIEDYHRLKNLIEQISGLNVKAFKDLARKQRIAKQTQTRSPDPTPLSGEKQ